MTDDNNIITEQQPVEYNDDNIRHLSDMEHVRTRPGMYIGRLGDGSLPEDGIYVLLKEVIDNSIDEFKMNAGDRIEINIEENLRVSVRDYGRGIPQGKLIEAVSMLNTGGKYDSKAFKKSVGLNGVGVKAVNALSAHFEVASYREGKVRRAVFECGKLVSDTTEPSQDENGTYIYFEPDATKFVGYRFHDEFVETMLRNYTYLNTSEILKWVLETADRTIDNPKPYPILKAQGKYPSIINYDADHAPTLTLVNGKPSEDNRNKGGKFGTLTVKIQMGDGAVYKRPSGAAITTQQLSLNITDKDPDHFNFNYYKVQLPYYNDVGTKNYNGNRVVTGWKIVNIEDGTPGT